MSICIIVAYIAHHWRTPWCVRKCLYEQKGTSVIVTIVIISPRGFEIFCSRCSNWKHFLSCFSMAVDKNCSRVEYRVHSLYAAVVTWFLSHVGLYPITRGRKVRETFSAKWCRLRYYNFTDKSFCQLDSQVIRKSRNNSRFFAMACEIVKCSRGCCLMKNVENAPSALAGARLGYLLNVNASARMSISVAINTHALTPIFVQNLARECKQLTRGTKSVTITCQTMRKWETSKAGAS